VRQELRGERTGIRYAIGTRVDIQVSRVDLDGRKIDFRLVQGSLMPLGKSHLDKLPPSPPARSGLGKPGKAAPAAKAPRGKNSAAATKKAAAKAKAPRKRR
jgi:ribonuclease R